MKNVDLDQRKEGCFLCFLESATNPSGRHRTGISQHESNTNHQETEFISVSFKEPRDVGQASRSLMGDLKLSPELTSLLLGKRMRKHGRGCKLSSSLWPWELC